MRGTPQSGRRRRRFVVLLALTLTFVLSATAGCGLFDSGRGDDAGAADDAAAGDRLTILTTLYPLAEFAATVGGDLVDVDLILPPGVHAHDFDPSPRDIERIMRADRLLFSSIGADPWLENLRNVIETDGGPQLVDVAAAVEPLPLAAAGLTPDIAAGVDDVHDHERGQAGDAAHAHDRDHARSGYDPHVWLDPKRAQEIVNTIAAALSDALPQHAAIFVENAASLNAALADLDEEFRTGLAGCTRRDVFVQHAAFAYLLDAYGLRQVALSGLTGHATPTLRQLNSLLQLARERQVQAVYYEAFVDPAAARMFAGELGADLFELHALENLSAEQRAAGETYFSLMRKNLAALRSGLACED